MSNTKVKKEFLPIPEGSYLMRMTAYEEVETRNKKGILAKVQFKVASGEFKDQLIFDQMIVKHESDKAQEIGLKRLDSYLKAVNNGEGLDSLGYDRSSIADELTGIPFIGVVIIEEPKEYTDHEGNLKTSKAKNVIKYFNAR